MRHSFVFALSVALLASCATKEIDFQTPAPGDGEMVFHAYFEQPTSDTRVYATEDLFLRWHADDRVSIFNQNTFNQQYMFDGETGDNSGDFSIVGDSEATAGTAIPNVVSVYPYQPSTCISGSQVLTIDLPVKQAYAENTFGRGANTMISVSSDNYLQYKNVGGYLMLKLYGEGISVSSITLRGNNEEKLAGKASVTMPLNGVPSATMSNDATTEITLACATPVRLGATAEESTQFWFVVPPVTFTKGFTVTVNVSGGGIFRKATSKSVTIERNNLSKMAPMEVLIPVPEAIDLGLPSGLKWASFNLGATAPEEYGDYYAWGETESKENYTWSTYKWCEGSYNTLTKYCGIASYGNNGFTDTKVVLDLEDDAANVNLGDNWRVPTDVEWEELIDNCTWTWTKQNGVNGRLVTSNINGNNIFFPAAGYLYYAGLGDVGSFGNYTSSSLSSGRSHFRWGVRFSSSDVFRNEGARCNGQSIRPVSDDRIHPESVSLDKSSLSLEVDKSEQLVATVSPANATDRRVTWTSSDESVAIVSSDGLVKGVAGGSAVITATTTDGGKTASCNVTVKAPVVPVPEAVDLGLSVKWASFNLGASKPEDYGDYHAWGDPEAYYSSLDPLTWKEGKSGGYNWSSYKWCMGSSSTMTKYCPNSEYGYNGFTDNKTVLDPEDDAAHMYLGGKWRMPTDAEWTALRNNCTWTWTTQNGVSGSLVTASNGNSIFLPASGRRYNTRLGEAGTFGHYWSSSLANGVSSSARSVRHDSDAVQMYASTRYYGFSVRPVYAE